MLAWDSFKSHVMSAIRTRVKDFYNTHMVVIPGGCTGILQPADLSWNKPFKATYREKYEEWAIDGEVSLTAGSRRRPPPRDLIMQRVKEAWVSVSAETVRKSFKKCGITNSMGGTEDDQIFASDNEEYVDDSDPFSDSEDSVQDTATGNGEPVQLDTEDETDNEPTEQDLESMDDYETGDLSSPGR
jgi:hypothetical protein